MLIAILEICTHTHYSAINGLIKTYSIDPSNSIIVYTNEAIERALQENGVTPNTSFVLFDPNKGAAHFLNTIAQTHYDRLHICTIENYYREFGDFRPKVNEIIFHVHNVDIWFDSHLTNNIKNLLFNLRHGNNVLRSTGKMIRDIIVRNSIKGKILTWIQNGNHKYIVHSEGQKKYLSEFVECQDIIVFPFAINEGTGASKPKRDANARIRICIPGIVTDARRDYSGLSKILEEIMPEIKDKLMFDFLGYVKYEETELMARIQKLENHGLTLITYKEFVYGSQFDNALEQADILLNNQIVTVSHTTKYGVSKESGMLFNMIRGAKPAIFPTEYGVDQEFEEALIYYDSPAQLKTILLRLANGSIDIGKYKTKIDAIAEAYTPTKLYPRLVKSE